MLPKNRRIERKFFNQTTNSGKRYNSESLVLYVTKISQENGTSPSRFAFSASKKISKLAVDRNKLRRRGYSVILRIINRIKPGYFCFFSYKKGYNTDFKMLEDEIVGLLSSMGMIV